MDINNELVRKHFQIHHLRDLLKNLKKSKNNADRNKVLLISFINTGLRLKKKNLKNPKSQMK